MEDTRALCCVGDLLHDVVVRLTDTIAHATDTPAIIGSRRGGSAANVAVAAAAAGGRARFVGNVGTDLVGDALIGALVAAGVEPHVTRRGRTGSVVALVDVDGERSMLTDRADADDVTGLDETCLDDAHTVHIPVYSFTGGVLATTALELGVAAHRSGVRVSVDLSSVALLEELGRPQVDDILDTIRPDVVFANSDEAHWLLHGAPRAEPARSPLYIVKNGGRPAVVHQHGSPPELVAPPDQGTVEDSTGAGDAFAGGFLVALAAGATPVEATMAGHRRAWLTLTSRSDRPA
jgi:sugar/nucleoside kinase (ribokinase family)